MEMWPSNDATATCCPSGRKQTANPSAVKFTVSRVREAAEETASHTRKVLSHDTLTNKLLDRLGLKHKLLTGPSCPLKNNQRG